MDNIEKLRRDSIALDIRKPVEYVRGGTRFGGRPDVPANFVWPTYKGKPLAFLSQFDCHALKNYDLSEQLPNQGVLSFFYELESQEWGFDPDNRGCCRVFWFGDTDNLVQAEFPAELAEEYRLPMLEIEPYSVESFPSEDDFYELHKDAPFGSWETWKEDEEEHRLLGWPDTIQGSMFTKVDLVSQGYWMGGGGGPNIPIPDEVLGRAQESAADRWQLLLQLGHVTSGKFDLMFGDMGRIYFFIPKEDLEAWRFDNVWLILQCY